MLVQDSNCNGERLFKEKFVEELKLLEEDSINKKMVLEMVEQGKHLVKFVLPSLIEYFGQYDVVSVEESLFE